MRRRGGEGCELSQGRKRQEEMKGEGNEEESVVAMERLGKE